jgi:peptidoglycan/xylan/chitin deacetylase (PgdA/CDA1 family)
MNDSKPPMTLSIDMDNKWCFMHTDGDEGWHHCPTHLPEIVPRKLSFFEKYSQPITFFIVGVDATKEVNRPALASIPGFGHEIASHSFLHQPWLHTYSGERIEQEF